MSTYLKISEFSRLSGISRKNLIFYDEIGLLKPEKVDTNGYRMYSYQQIYPVSIIAAFRDLGMPLKDIKTYMESRTPELLVEVFRQQNIILEEKLKRLHSIQHMIDFRIRQTQSAAQIHLDQLTLQDCPEEIFFATEELHITTDKEQEQAAIAFYDRYDAAQMIYGYPLGTMISKEHLEKRYVEFPDRIYFRQLPSQITSCRYVKPAGCYLTAYCQAGYMVPSNTYERMFKYIKKNNLIITGCSYEEFILDEVCLSDPESYLLQISIQVSKPSD